MLSSLMGGGGGHTSKEFAYGMLMFAVVLSLVFPMVLSVYYLDDDGDDEYADEMDSLNAAYAQMTGTQSSTYTNKVWALSGIYTPVDSTDRYGYTDDGWLYGEKILSYSPSQYQIGTNNYFTVEYNKDKGYYVYTTVPANQSDSISVGDIYSAVTFSKDKQSNVFFTSDLKQESDGHFYYKYTGWRYAFSPLTTYTGVTEDGKTQQVYADKTSLSLVWYNYQGVSGIAGQLVLTGSDSGVQYITAAEIVNAYNSSNSTATFKMYFGGTVCNLVIRLNPTFIAQGNTVADCYNNGYWSIMVSSPQSTATDGSSSSGFDINTVLDVIVDLFTFNMTEYGLSGTAATLCSLFYVIPMFMALILIFTSIYPVVIFAGVLALLRIISEWNFF